MRREESPLARRALRITLAACLLIPALGPAEPQAVEPVRVQALRISDDDGTRPANVTPAQMKQWVDFANRVFAAAAIRFEFDPEAGEYASVRSTLLNHMTGTDDRNWPEARRVGNRIAARYPGRMVVFLRYGPGEIATDGGFSWWDYNFIVMPGFADDIHCGHPHYNALAHEVGHYLGLSHTFAVAPFADVNAAEAFFREKGRNPSVFDGDGLPDTPPDPAIRAYECPRVRRIALGGVSFDLPRRNIMSYYDERDSLSPQQIERVTWFLRMRRLGAGTAPANTQPPPGLPRPGGGNAEMRNQQPAGG